MCRNFIASLAVGVLFCTCMSGCGTDQEKGVKKQISLINELCDDMDKVKSNTTLLDEKSDFEKVGAKLSDNENEVKKLPKPSADDLKKMKDSYKQDWDKAMARLKDDAMRIEKDISIRAMSDIGEYTKYRPGQDTVAEWMESK